MATTSLQTLTGIILRTDVNACLGADLLAMGLETPEASADEAIAALEFNKPLQSAMSGEESMQQWRRYVGLHRTMQIRSVTGVWVHPSNLVLVPAESPDFVVTTGPHDALVAFCTQQALPLHMAT